MKNIIRQTFIGMFTIPHEICHYLTGRLLGVRTQIIDISHTKAYNYDYVPAWKMVAIDLAPTVLGIILALALGLFVFEMPKQRVVIGLLGGWYVLFSLLGCLGDWRDAWHDRTHLTSEHVQETNKV